MLARLVTLGASASRPGAGWFWVPNLCKATSRRSNPDQTAVKRLMTPRTRHGSEAPGGRRLGLSTSEAARHLGVSLSTIRRWSDMGHLRGYRTPGGQRRFSVEQLDAFLASLEQENRLLTADGQRLVGAAASFIRRSMSSSAS